MTAVVQLPSFHAGQAKIYRERAPRNVVRCGRRFGKTKMMVTQAGDAAAKGRRVGLFTPEHKQLLEPYVELLRVLAPVRESASRNEGVIRTTTGGVVDFWHTTDNLLAGRGREYDLVLGDEMAFTKDGQMADVWEQSIEPTMLTKPDAKVWLYGTPNGLNPENFFWQVCRSGRDLYAGFKEHHAPSDVNPLVTAAQMETYRARNHPLVFQQEYLAEFVDFSGVAFFSRDALLVDGQPVPTPTACDAIFAVVDTAVKGGSEHDGTAVLYCATSSMGPHALVLLDWDVVSIDGAMLEHWLPGVFRRCEELARECRAIYGVRGTFIEDAAAGSVLLQQCQARGWPAEALPSNLTAAGKDGRALNASGPVYRGEVKISAPAYFKVAEFKGTTQNHLLSQVSGFRVGDKQAAKRSDDLLDCAVYSVAIACGNSEGVA